MLNYKRLVAIGAVATLLAGGTATADCVDPYKPAIERTELSTNHNSYAEESEICITEKAEYCDHCVAGYKHKCEGGWWQPQTHLSCSKKETIEQSGATSNQATESMNQTTNPTASNSSSSGAVFGCDDQGRSAQWAALKRCESEIPRGLTDDKYCPHYQRAVQCLLDVQKNSESCSRDIYSAEDWVSEYREKARLICFYNP